MTDTWNIVSATVNKFLCVLGDPEACGGVDTTAYAESLQLPRNTIIELIGNIRCAISSWPPPDDVLYFDRDPEFNAKIQPAIFEMFSTVVNSDTHQILVDVIEGVEADIIEDGVDDENDYWTNTQNK